MSILDDLTDKFTEELDAELVCDPKYRQANEQLHEFCEVCLTPEQADQLNELISKLSSAIFHAASRSGMQIGAKIAAGLLND